MQILQVVDKTGSAIDILAKFIQREIRQHKIDILPLHPKRPDNETIKFLKENWNNYDLIHWQYWRSWKKAQELIREIDAKPSILSHYNPYDIEEEQWMEHDVNVFALESQRSRVGHGQVIRLAVDEKMWEWKPNNEKTVGMCANRIESKKGILEAAQVANEMGLRFILMGRISDPSYAKQVLELPNVEFHENIPFKNMQEIYNRMGVYVVNSIDNFETGPMPPIEALLCGVPVISRPVGTMTEVFEDRKHMLFFDDKKEMKKRIQEAFDQREELREQGWREAKNLNSVRYARQYNQLYHRVLFPNQEIVTVICPYREDRLHTWDETYHSIQGQTWRNIETMMKADVEPGYNLARIRNEMITEASGKYILLLDDRWNLGEPDTIQKMVEQLNDRDKVFIYGTKRPHGLGRTNFVENFALCKRQDLIDAGMFNERIDCYGGMSQEIRTRLNRQGWEFKRCEKAFADQKMKSSNKNRKASIIRAKNLLYKMGM